MAKNGNKKPEVTLPDPDDLSPKTWKDLKAAKTSRKTQHTMVLDTSVINALIPARTRLEAANKAEDPEAIAEAQAEVDRVTERLEEVTVTWHVQAIGKTELTDLIRKHPATGAQQKAHRKRLAAGETGMDELLRFNPDTFGPELLAACLVEPGPTLTVEEAREMWADPEWSEGEVGGLFNVAWTLNQIGA